MITIDLDDRAVLAALAQLRDHLQDLSPAFREIGSSLVDEIKRGFSEGRSPYGLPWQRLSWVTMTRRMGGEKKIFTKTGKIKASKVREAAAGFQPLLDTGKLRNSITYRLFGQGGVEVGTADYEKKALMHQFGSVKGWGRGIKIPARPFLPIQGGSSDGTAVLPEAWRQQVLDILLDHLAPR